MKILIVTPLLLCSALSFADSQTNPTNWGDAFSNKRDAGGYFSIGLAVHNQHGLYQPSDTEADLIFSGAYYFENGLFAELPSHNDKFETSLTLGYNLANVGEWEFDTIYSYAHGSLQRGNVDVKEKTPYLGIRATGTIAGIDTMFSYGLNTNNKRYSNGHYAAAWFAKSWNVKNWYIYGSLGLQYRNSKMLDYYYGVEQSDIYHTNYQADAGVNIIYKLGVKKPINEDWVVEGFFSYTDYADSIIDSPYTQNVLRYYDGDRSDKGRVLSLSINYVF